MLATTSPARHTSCVERSGADPAPVNFDPATHPILAAHWFEDELFRPIGSIAAAVVANPLFQRQVERLHQIGARAVGELLAELGVELGVQTLINKKLATYAKLDPKVVEAAGGDRFWPAPLHEIRRAS